MSYLNTNPRKARNILTTLAKMLEDRGLFLDSEYQQIRNAIETDESKATEYYSTTVCAMKGFNETYSKTETVQVMLPKEDKLAVDTIRQYETDYAEVAGMSLIIVVQHVTPAAKQILQKHKNFQLFYETDLFHNRTHHVLYMPHRALLPNEEKTILDKFCCKKANLPSIRVTDPIVRYFNWPVGKIIEIQCKTSGVVEPSVYYRVVVTD